MAVRAWSAVIAALLSAGLHLQAQASEAEYVAFRVDEQRLIATVLVREIAGQVTEGLSPKPVAKYGYRHFPLPPWWKEREAFSTPDADRWVVQLAPGQVIEAAAEGVVAGQPLCSEAIGVMLRATPRHAAAIAASPARYFVASPSVAGLPVTSERSPLGARPETFAQEWRRSLELLLNELVARELPRVRADAEKALSRAEASTVRYHRTWARERRRIDSAMERGKRELKYDVQAFQLGPGVPVYFVRAEWLVSGLQGFAASLWVRTDPRFEIVETNLRPAAWLRMGEFQGHVTREHLGLVLNVLDRDRDGWGEILFLQTGYEGFSISARVCSLSGFGPADLQYGGGC